GPRRLRGTRSISVTMRTPGNDFDLAAGFLMTEGVIRDANDIRHITNAGDPFSEDNPTSQVMDSLKLGSKQNVVRVEVSIPRQSRGLYDVSRSKRLVRGR